MGLENLPPAKPLTERRKQPYNTVPVQPAESPTESTPVTEKPDESTDGSATAPDNIAQ